MAGRMRTNKRTRGVFEANMERAREITENMPPAILGVFAPDEMQELERLREEFVNVYREAWNTNAGLTTARINAMSRAELKASIASLRQMIEINKKRREQYGEGVSIDQYYGVSRHDDEEFSGMEHTQ